MRKTKAFTLVELIIVIAIIAIISAVSWSSLSGAKKTSAVNDACNQVAVMINKTRNYALSGKQVGGKPSKSFEIKTGSSITIKGTDKDNDSLTMETLTLTGGVTCDNKTLRYSVPNGEANFTGANDMACYDTAFVTTRTVKVSPYTAFCQ